MKRFLLFAAFSLYLSSYTFAQSEEQQIRSVLGNFLEGTSFNYPDKIRSAFHPNTPMFLYNPADTLYIISSDKYASFYSRKAPGTPNARYGRIIAIDIEKDIASAKIETIMPNWGNRYVDILLLKKIDGSWKIISKAATAEPIPKTHAAMTTKPAKEVVMTGLKRPWSMAFLSADEAIITEKDGDLVRVNLKTKAKQKIKGLPQDVGRKVRIDTSKHAWGVFPPRAHGSDQNYNAGWFQVLTDPDFANNSYLYISYAAENQERASTTKVIRGKLSGNQLTDIETLFLAAPYSHGLFHYGGGMTFGPDGKLYITIGERNLFEHLNPVPPSSQDVTDRRGKIIRINSDGSIPDDNPDFGPDAIKGLYATGIRASQGLTVDPTGTLWFSEHGTIQGDELNILSPGANYGWPYVTSGSYRSEGYNPAVPSGTKFTDPVHFWDQTIAPTGLTFYSGRQFPQWIGNLIVPGLSKGNLWRMVIQDNKVVSAQELFINDRVRLRKAVMSPDGELYLLTDEEDGKVIRVINDNSSSDW